MPADISSTSIPNELAILTELMLSEIGPFFTIFFFFSISFHFLYFTFFYSRFFFPLFFTINTMHVPMGFPEQWHNTKHIVSSPHTH